MLHWSLFQGTTELDSPDEEQEMVYFAITQKTRHSELPTASLVVLQFLLLALRTFSSKQGRDIYKDDRVAGLTKGARFQGSSSLE